MENQINPQQIDQLTHETDLQFAGSTDPLVEQPIAEDDSGTPVEDTSDVASHVNIEVILDEIAALSEPDQLVGDDADKPVVDRATDLKPEVSDQAEPRVSDRDWDRDADRISDRSADRITDRSPSIDSAPDRPGPTDTARPIDPVTDRAPVQLADRATDLQPPSRIEPAPEVDPLEGGRLSRGIRSYLESPAERDGVKEVSLVMPHGAEKDFARAGGTAWDQSIFNRADDLSTDEPVSILDLARKHGHDVQDAFDEVRDKQTDLRDDRLEDRVEELVGAIEELVDVLVDSVATIAQIDPIDPGLVQALGDTATDFIANTDPASLFTASDFAGHDLLTDAITLVAGDGSITDPVSDAISVIAQSDPVTDVLTVTLADVLIDDANPDGSIDLLLGTPTQTSTSGDVTSPDLVNQDAVTDAFANTTLASDLVVGSLTPVQEPVSLVG